MQGSSKLRAATAETGLYDVYAEALVFRGGVVVRYSALPARLSDLWARMPPIVSVFLTGLPGQARHDQLTAF